MHYSLVRAGPMGFSRLHCMHVGHNAVRGPWYAGLS